MQHTQQGREEAAEQGASSHLHKAPRDLELRTDRTGQQRGDLGLVLGPQMI